VLRPGRPLLSFSRKSYPHRAAANSVGAGGIAGLAIHFSRAFGCEVIALCLTRGREAKARRIGAHHVYSCTDQESLRSLAGAFDCLMLTDDHGAPSQELLRALRKGGAVYRLDTTGEEAPIEPLVRSVGEVVNHLESGTVRPGRNA
jgi:D-arabinose 1-dehydrogenase-like Zn-dependent alcohol dehydrogenase